MCLTGKTRNVTQYAKRVSMKEIAQGVQPKNTLLAWRVWKVQALFPSVTLRSQSQNTIWAPGKSVDGKVDEKNSEGVHAYDTIAAMVKGGYTGSKTDFKQQDVIVGQIVLWGKVAQHDNGYRAEHGYPFLIYANGPELRTRIAAHYGCLAARDFIPRLLAEAA